MKKLNNGYYKCETCGRKMDNHRKMKRHERLCGIDKISGYIEGVENIWNLDIPENDTTETRQIKLGEEVLGRCSVCDSRMISKDRLKEGRNLFECGNCGKINRFDN